MSPVLASHRDALTLGLLKRDELGEHLRQLLLALGDLAGWPASQRPRAAQVFLRHGASIGSGCSPSGHFVSRRAVHPRAFDGLARLLGRRRLRDHLGQHLLHDALHLLGCDRGAEHLQAP